MRAQKSPAIDQSTCSILNSYTLNSESWSQSIQKYLQGSKVCFETQGSQALQCLHLLGGEIPPHIDLGKNKYGGLFTNDEVEDCLDTM